jgi:hypothetical protein
MKTSRSLKSDRRSVTSRIKFVIYRTSKDGKPEPENRARSLNQLEDDELNHCYAKASSMTLQKDGQLALSLSSSRHIVFDTSSGSLLGTELAALYELRYEEPEPRSGLARAAGDTEHGKLRASRVKQAPYAAPKQDVGQPADRPDYDRTIGQSTFTSTIQHGMIFNTIIHTGAWAKGQRSPSQIEVMGQNAKNYFLDQFLHQGGKDLTSTQRQEDLAEVDGRFEWLHIIGASLGGLNVLGNLVCGTYDPNSEMIALEHRVARWGQKGYVGTFRPTPETPVKIVGIAVLTDLGYIAKQIILLVYHGTTLVARAQYATLQPTVLTKSRYKQAEAEIEDSIKSIKKQRGEGSDDDNSNKSSASSASSPKSKKSRPTPFIARRTLPAPSSRQASLSSAYSSNSSSLSSRSSFHFSAPRPSDQDRSSSSSPRLFSSSTARTTEKRPRSPSSSEKSSEVTATTSSFDDYDNDPLDAALEIVERISPKDHALFQKAIESTNVDTDMLHEHMLAYRNTLSREQWKALKRALGFE